MPPSHIPRVCTSALILHRGTTWRQLVSYMPQTHKPWYPLNRGLGGSHSQPGWFR